MAYKLQLPDDSKIHNVFHVSLLKAFKGDHESGTIAPTIPNDFGSNSKYPKSIVGVQKVASDGEPNEQVLVKWCHQQPKDASWEDLDEFWAAFLDYHLADKVIVQALTSDTTMTT